MIQNFFISIRFFIVFTLICGVIYPLLVQLFTYLGFVELSKGSLIYEGDRVIGSRLLGQYNREPQYFWTRPSATLPPYNASASAASNSAVIDPAYKATVEMRINRLKLINPDYTGSVPVDAVTASASGLDPHISVENANMQSLRVAKERKMDINEVQKLIREQTEEKQFGILGGPRVNVLELNLALDKVNAAKQQNSKPESAIQ